MKSFSFLFIFLSLSLLGSGCVSRGKAREAHIKFGIPSIFSVEKKQTGTSLSESGLVKAADTSTKIQILLFEWESGGKGVELKFEKEKTEKP